MPRFQSRFAAFCLYALSAGAAMPSVAEDADIGRAAASAEPVLVSEVTAIELSVQKIKPPILIVAATGNAPMGAFEEQGFLVRFRYTTPPQDGIQEYQLFANPAPDSHSTKEITASDEWRNYESEAPWLKGVRVYGVGEGIKQRMLEGRVTDTSAPDAGEVRYASAPSQCRFLGATSVAVELDPDQQDLRKAMLQLDENTFAFLNDFGDHGFTQVYYPPVTVGLTQLRLADPLQQDRRIFDVLPPRNWPFPLNGRKLRLVLPKGGNNDAARLVLSDRYGNVSRTLELERTAP